MYRYSDIVENQRVISYQIKNSQVVTNVQHLNFIHNSLKCQIKLNFRIKSEMCK
jgi:hypothetical protein